MALDSRNIGKEGTFLVYKVSEKSFRVFLGKLKNVRRKPQGSPCNIKREPTWQAVKADRVEGS
jgi:hypothetical protein